MEPQNYWENVKCPNGKPEWNSVLGTWILFVPQDAIPDVWNEVACLTLRGQLGYMTSLSPGPMTYGAHIGDWCIAIHTEDGGSDHVIDMLITKDLAIPYVQRYDLRG